MAPENVAPVVAILLGALIELTGLLAPLLRRPNAGSEREGDAAPSSQPGRPPAILSTPPPEATRAATPLDAAPCATAADHDATAKPVPPPPVAARDMRRRPPNIAETATSTATAVTRALRHVAADSVRAKPTPPASHVATSDAADAVRPCDKTATGGATRATTMLRPVAPLENGTRAEPPCESAGRASGRGAAATGRDLDEVLRALCESPGGAGGLVGMSQKRAATTLATRFGVDPRTLERDLKKLRERGALTLKGGKIRVNAPADARLIPRDTRP